MLERQTGSRLQKEFGKVIIYLRNCLTFTPKQIMRNVLGEDSYDTVSIGGRAISELRYEDDTVLLSTSEQGLTRLLESARRFSEEAGLLINTNKPKLMKLDRAPNLMGVTLNRKQLEDVTSFEHLGVRIQNNGDNFKEIKKRLAMGTTALGRLKRLWRDTDTTTRMNILKAIVFPVERMRILGVHGRS